MKIREKNSYLASSPKKIRNFGHWLKGGVVVKDSR